MRSFFLLFAVAVTSSFLSSCAGEPFYRGYLLSEKKESQATQVTVHRDNKAESNLDHLFVDSNKLIATHNHN